MATDGRHCPNCDLSRNAKLEAVAEAALGLQAWADSIELYREASARGRLRGALAQLGATQEEEGHG
ncbi:MAG: hypothetical protein ACREOA_05770 [Candidatus Dormibacteria bacterium]